VRLAAALVLAALGTPALGASVTGSVEIVGKKGKRLADASDAVVWIDGIALRPTPVRATVRMKDKSFVPHLLVIPTGSTVDFPNDDVILHNVFSVSADNRFDLDLYKRPKSAARTFERPGIVRVYCNIHPQMSAIVVVRDNPFFARTRPDGSFVIEGVPAGRHTVRAWHERGGSEARAEIVVPETGSVRVGLTIDASRYREAPHKNKHGEDYSSDDRY
jgi:plastocyanin